MSKNRKKMQKTRRKVYSKGSINRFVDDMIHPMFKQNASFILVDGFIHSLVEQNLPSSVRKFIRYNLPKLLKQLSEG